MLAIYSVSEQSRLDGQGFLKLCPTMLQQLDAGTCALQGKEELGGEASARPTNTEGKHWLLLNSGHLFLAQWNTKGVGPL